MKQSRIATHKIDSGLGGIYPVRIVRVLDFSRVEVEVIAPSTEFDGMKFYPCSQELKPLEVKP